MTSPSALTTRTLGRSGIEVSALGLGCWAIGGPTKGEDGRTIGCGEVDESASVRAIQRGFDLGVTLFDTADVYGAGHRRGCWPWRWPVIWTRSSSPPSSVSPSTTTAAVTGAAWT